jgi:hypothetical protein
MSNLHSRPGAFKAPPSTADGNVINFRPRASRATPSAFDELTMALILVKYDRGELSREVLVALLAGVGLAQ